jgi:hypothetical protein
LTLPLSARERLRALAMMASWSHDDVIDVSNALPALLAEAETLARIRALRDDIASQGRWMGADAYEQLFNRLLALLDGETPQRET